MFVKLTVKGSPQTKHPAILFLLLDWSITTSQTTWNVQESFIKYMDSMPGEIVSCRIKEMECFHYREGWKKNCRGRKIKSYGRKCLKSSSLLGTETDTWVIWVHNIFITVWFVESFECWKYFNFSSSVMMTLHFTRGSKLCIISCQPVG